MGVIVPVGFGIAKLRWRIITSPDEMITTYGYVNGGVATAQEDADEIFDNFTVAGSPGNAGKVSTKYKTVGVEVSLMTGTGPVTAEHVNNVTGTGTGTPLTSNTSVLVKKLTNRGGRKGRGRMYVPGIQVSEIDVDENGIIGSTDLANIQTCWGAFFALVDASSQPMVLLHADGSTPDPVTSLQVEAVVATQRRRLRR